MPISGMATANAKVVFSQGGLQIVSGMVTVNQFVQNRRHDHDEPCVDAKRCRGQIRKRWCSSRRPPPAFAPAASVVVNDDPDLARQPKETSQPHGHLLRHGDSQDPGQRGKALATGYFDMPAPQGRVVRRRSIPIFFRAR